MPKETKTKRAPKTRVEKKKKGTSLTFLDLTVALS